MVMENRTDPETTIPSSASACRTHHPVRGAGFKVAAVLVAAVAVLAASGFLVMQFKRPPASAPGTPTDPKQAEAIKLGGVPLFHNWPKPELALVLSAQQYGYLLPCGCSRPQQGGLERRYNFVQTVKERGWPMLALDLGDIPQRHGPQKLPNLQGLLKYEYSMKALREIGYSAVTFGENETVLPLDRALGQYALNNPTPAVLIDNLTRDAQDTFPETGRFQVIQPAGSPLKVGVAALVGPTVAKRIQDPKVKFEEDVRGNERVPANERVLTRVLKEMDKQKPDLRVLLYQGLPKEAQSCAARFPEFHVILCLGEFEEPSGEPLRAGQTLIIAVGHKGRYVGVVGAARTNLPDKPFDLRYQLVPMSEQFLTAKGKEKEQPVLALLEQYTQELQRDNYLKEYGQTRHPLQVQFPQATYVGSEACKKCHEGAFVVWEKSRHAHAYQTLVDAKNPSLRQHDAECVVCHVTGFTYQGGFTSAAKTPHLKNVGCESCHGPASLHVQDPKNVAFRTALNPWKALPNEPEAKRTARIDQSCQKCHDSDNDVHWTFEKWKDVAH